MADIFKLLVLLFQNEQVLNFSHNQNTLLSIINRAAHGTTFLSKSEMEAIYGEDLKWEHFEDAQNYVRATCGD